MLNPKSVFALVTFGALVAAPLSADDDLAELAERVRNSEEVYTQLVDAPDQGVPKKLLDNCKCVAVIPHVVKGAFVVGARHGKGIVSCRSNGRWSPPAFLTVSGGSVGFQIGGQATDVVLFLMSEKGARSLLKSEFTLGADASVAAGPVGRSAAAATDVRLDAEIYAYSRSKGLFAGIALDGANINPDEDAVETYYGQSISPETILFKREVPRIRDEAKSFMQRLP
ncbi:MAG TPA: lipid-binding SYLF domain-containing protein [Acidobacteriota bacterium]